MKISIKYMFLCFMLGSCVLVKGQQKMAWDEAYREADAKIEQLTLDEKIHFMRGYSLFFFYGVPEKGIPYLYHSDATQGVNIRRNLPDTTMVHQLERSTAFPCPLMLAATFNPNLVRRYAMAVGEECRAGGIEVLLGPGVNMTRNSQCGRNFEYFGEDPYLSSVITEEYVRAIQSTGTAACLKHFICNETEFYRRRSNSVVDERALHEIYLPPFKAGIDAGAAYVMTSYNQLNGEWTGQNRYLLKELLREKMGFRGCVMSDWSSVYDTEKVVKNGVNTEMPGRKELFSEVKSLLAEGRITEKDIEQMIQPVIATGIAFGLYNREKYIPEWLNKYPQHEQTAYDVAAEGITLLSNNGILPLRTARKILLTGRFLHEVPRTGDNPAASAAVKGYNNVTLAKAMYDTYGDALTIVEQPTYEQLASADVVLVSAGTIDMESFERPFALPRQQEKLICMAVEANPNTIVLINSGSGVRMTGWSDKVAALIYGWYPGQNGMKAVTDVVSGKLTPSGKLPMTIEREFSDSPARNTMPVGAEFYHTAYRAYNEKLISVYDVNYDESVLVGYRWYDTKKIRPLYPFGYGLSYTTFSLSKPQIQIGHDFARVRIILANTGKREGSEVVQLYVSEKSPTVVRPEKELKAFRKVALEAGKKTLVEFELDLKDLAFWDTELHDWKVNPGEYIIKIGTSSADIACSLSWIVKE
ncbi:beta-glucosidase [Dysgonomonas sp. 511]|uniref:beta-glucosidase family protein n=1 Tax=Dysgonomonas sp. 511 TaxID=2302930 RepID=UPI0013D6969C|nr:glycoside hydrolase family 3 N-terminal domain-containing protein [Dysgonomonas sp. 511]NDV79419.1 glycosyl hydrolase [Dysgonomonas sp. 511]